MRNTDGTAPRRATISSVVMPFAVKNCDSTFTGKVGGGILTSLLETSPSSLPVGTPYVGPPDNGTTSLVASATMSAHETVKGHTTLIASFTLSIRSYPLTDSFVPLSFFVVVLLVESMRMNASQL